MKKAGEYQPPINTKKCSKNKKKASPKSAQPQFSFAHWTLEFGALKYTYLFMIFSIKFNKTRANIKLNNMKRKKKAGKWVGYYLLATCARVIYLFILIFKDKF